MKLKRIILTNIRSYNNETIEFPEGSTLLSGDIGSGKTSILLAIEFALFGLQPGQRGNSILRNGEDAGGVTMVFEVDSKEIVIERTLKRAKSISQDYAAITIDGEKKESSVTELKDKVLSLLHYPKEFAKKQNLLYKFTVYTPQEEMKQIILQDAETRINTLRHVFGIDKYKKILENLTILVQKIREEKRAKEALTAHFEEDKQEILKKEEELQTKQYNLISVEKEHFEKKEARKEVEESQKEILEKVEEKRNLEKEIEKTRLMEMNKKELIAQNKKTMQRIDESIAELESLHFDEEMIARHETQIATLKKKKEEASEKKLRVTSLMHSLEIKIKEAQMTKEKLRHLEVCPTCLQDVDTTYKANVSTKLDNDMMKNAKESESLLREQKELTATITSFDYEIMQKEKALQELRIVKVKREQLSEHRARKTELEKLNQALTNDLVLLDEQRERLMERMASLKKYDALFEQKRGELLSAQREERMAEIKVAELKKEIELFTSQIGELKEKIEKVKNIQKELAHLMNLEAWLTKKFSPLVSFVEKNVMVALKAEFSELFAKWFLMLVSENFNVSVRDDFTPVIEQQDYEIDYAYLSGGERTAIALAYRLALNQVINSLLSKIKTRDFVILDEPTDGFSDTQLDKMREVLEQLNVGQLIIVSHEQKIEGFVENVIKLKKDTGVSVKS